MDKIKQIIKSFGNGIRYNDKNGVLVKDAFLIVDLTTKATTAAIDDVNQQLKNAGKLMRVTECKKKINSKTNELFPPALFVG